MTFIEDMTDRLRWVFNPSKAINRKCTEIMVRKSISQVIILLTESIYWKNPLKDLDSLSSEIDYLIKGTEGIKIHGELISPKQLISWTLEDDRYNLLNVKYNKDQVMRLIDKIKKEKGMPKAYVATDNLHKALVDLLLEAFKSMETPEGFTSIKDLPSFQIIKRHL